MLLEYDSAGFMWAAYVELEQHTQEYFHILPTSAT